MGTFFSFSLGLGLQLDPVVLSGPASIFGTMPPRLALTVGLDVSGLAANLSRAVVAQRIMNRFVAFKISSIQFVGTNAKITFCNLADRESVMRCESITIDDVVCPVWGGGPRPQNIFVYNYPYEGDEPYLRTVLSEFGDVQDVRFRHWLEIPGVADGVRVVSMIRKKAIPRHLTIDGFFFARYLIMVRLWSVTFAAKLVILLVIVRSRANVLSVCNLVTFSGTAPPVIPVPLLLSLLGS